MITNLVLLTIALWSGLSALAISGLRAFDNFAEQLGWWG